MIKMQRMADSIRRRLVGPLLCLPFLLAQLIAPGTMATAGPDGLRMVLCAGDGPITVVLTEDGDFVPVDGTGDDHDASGATCPWSLAFDKSAASGAQSAAEKVTAQMRLGLSWGIVQTIRLTIPQSHPARAPPITV